MYLDVHYLQCSEKLFCLALSLLLKFPGNEALAALEEKGTRGHYVSVERVQDIENGLIEWRNVQHPWWKLT